MMLICIIKYLILYFIEIRIFRWMMDIEVRSAFNSTIKSIIMIIGAIGIFICLFGLANVQLVSGMKFLTLLHKEEHHIDMSSLVGFAGFWNGYFQSIVIPFISSIVIIIIAYMIDDSILMVFEIVLCIIRIGISCEPTIIAICLVINYNPFIINFSLMDIVDWINKFLVKGC